MIIIMAPTKRMMRRDLSAPKPVADAADYQSDLFVIFVNDAVIHAPPSGPGITTPFVATIDKRSTGGGMGYVFSDSKNAVEWIASVAVGDVGAHMTSLRQLTEQERSECFYV